MVFDKEALIKRFAEESSAQFGPGDNILRDDVTYAADFVGEDLSEYGLDADDIVSKGPNIAVNDHFRAVASTIFFQKHSDWESEHEYRFVYYDVRNTDPIFVNVEGCVFGLIVGHDFASLHLSIAQEFDDVFSAGGCVAQCCWIGPRATIRELVESTGPKWEFGPSRETFIHVTGSNIDR